MELFCSRLTVHWWPFSVGWIRSMSSWLAMKMECFGSEWKKGKKQDELLELSRLSTRAQSKNRRPLSALTLTPTGSGTCWASSLQKSECIPSDYGLEEEMMRLKSRGACEKRIASSFVILAVNLHPLLFLCSRSRLVPITTTLLRTRSRSRIQSIQSSISGCCVADQLSCFF